MPVKQAVVELEAGVELLSSLPWTVMAQKVAWVVLSASAVAVLIRLVLGSCASWWHS
jgi:hypothetical protein